MIEQRKKRFPTCLLALLMVITCSFLFVQQFRKRYDPVTYRNAIQQIGLPALLTDVERLVTNQKRVHGQVKSGGFNWQKISNAPASIQSLPYVLKYSVQADSVVLMIRDVDFCFLEIYASTTESLPAESDDGYQRTRQIAERVYLFEAWYYWD